MGALRVLESGRGGAFPPEFRDDDGDVPAPRRSEPCDAMRRPETEERVLIATGSYVGEGFDDARLDTLFLTMPIFWRGTLAQYVGRLHRLHAAKREVLVHDYVDRAVPALMRMSGKRVRGYENLGYAVDRPGITLPELAGQDLLRRPGPPQAAANGGHADDDA